MGITDLFKRCKFTEFDIETFKYRTLGVDMYVLFHRYIDKDFAKDMVDEPGVYVERYYENIYRFLKQFTICNYKLFLVYDGDKMKFKITEKNREQRREAQKAAAMLSGDWSSCVDVVPQQMFNFHLFLKEKHPDFVFQFIVAPFEADAELAYLYRRNYINSVLTADSDLIIYGVEHILFMPTKGNELRVYETMNPSNEPTCINQIPIEKLWLFGYLIRCDYFEGIKGIGIVNSQSTQSLSLNL